MQQNYAAHANNFHPLFLSCQMSPSDIWINDKGVFPGNEQVENNEIRLRRHMMQFLFPSN